MNLNEFRRVFKRELNLWEINENWVMFKPCKLWNRLTDEEVKFKNLDEALDHVVDGLKIRKYIEKLDKIEQTYEGSGGSSSGSKGKVFKFSSASEGGGGTDNTRDLLPAYMNVSTKERSLQGAIKAFGDKYRNADHEYGATVDRLGYSTKHREGNAHSINISGKRGEYILHNHPSGGNFSKADMQSIAMGQAKGIVAIGKRGDYIFEKTNKFKPEKFYKAIDRAKPIGKNYDDAVGKWLTANQKKYGYKYSFNKLKKSK